MTREEIAERWPLPVAWARAAREVFGPVRLLAAANANGDQLREISAFTAERFANARRNVVIAELARPLDARLVE